MEVRDIHLLSAPRLPEIRPNPPLKQWGSRPNLPLNDFIQRVFGDNGIQRPGIAERERGADVGALGA